MKLLRCKTVFSKIMVVFVAIVVLSTVFSAFLISQMMASVYTRRTEDAMVNTAKEISSLACLNYYGAIDLTQLLSQLNVKASQEQYVIWVVDSNNSIWVSVDPSGQTQITEEEIYKYYNGMLEEINEGNIVKHVYNESGVFNTPVITIAMPIIVDGSTIGSVFVHNRLSVLNGSLAIIYQEIMIATIIGTAAAVLLSYFLAKSISKPITKITAATKQLATGSFDVRIKGVESADEIGQLAETFNVVAADLEKYENTRKSFVANVSHELRSPLTSMQGLVAGTLDGTIKEEDKNYYLGVVLDETKRLNKLINELLDLAHIESGKFPVDIEKVEINELLRRTLITFESRISEKELEVEVELCGDRQFVYADESRIKQVIMNLIDNAVKFAQKGGRLRIATTQSDASVFISINNSGKTIPKDELQYVFDRFYKADKSRTREEVTGTGLGLSIVKRILAQHGQSIWAESSEEDGTTFTFTLKKV